MFSGVMNAFSSFTGKTDPTPVQDPDDTGVTNFFDFLCAVFARIAYTDAPISLFLISSILEKIPPTIITALSTIQDISKLNDLDEQTMFGLPNGTIPTRTYNEKLCVDIRKYAEIMNAIIDDKETTKTSGNVSVISIADSNYGDVLIIGIKTLPNFVFVAYRGTYSAKTAQSYVQVSSIFPKPIEDNGKALQGIAKITYEIINSTSYAIEEMAKILGNTSAIPVFTGHSLGGAMATLMTRHWYNVKNHELYEQKDKQKAPPLIKPVCISFGAPRVLSKTTSEALCTRITNGDIVFHRYSNDGDPVTAAPVTGGYHHPCSSDKDKAAKRHEKVSRYCNSSSVTNATDVMPHIDYTKKIRCKKEPPNRLTKMANLAPRMAFHTTYLYVNFVKAADITHMALGAVPTGATSEIGRIVKDKKNNTVMRILQMDGDNLVGKYKVRYVDLTTVRSERTDATYAISDAKITREIFNDLLKEAKEIFINPAPFKKNVNAQEVKMFNSETKPIVGGKRKTRKRSKSRFTSSSI
jgi:hypothetical protein